MATKSKPTITVKAVTSLFEDGVTYAPGAELQVTEERAAALGDAVTGAPAGKPE